MFNFADVDNYNKNNYTEDVIDRQSREFLKKQNKISNSVHNLMQEGFTTKQSKGTKAFHDPSVLIDNFTYSEPSQQTVDKTIKKSNIQTEKTLGILQKNSGAIEDKNDEFNNKFNDYSQINSSILKNAKDYIDSGENKDINVFVNQLSNNNNTQFINLYNDDPNNNSNISKYDNMTIETCRDFARIKGYNNFSLSNTNSSNLSQCKMSKDIADLTKPGIYIPNCKVGPDGKTYGGGWGNAIYENNGTVPKYLGCYKDSSDRAMISAGDEEHTNKVYVAGSYGCAPWGSGDSSIISAADWIWYTENSANGAPVNIDQPVTIRGEINVSQISYCELFCIADDKCNIIINGNSYNQPLVKDANTDARSLKCEPEIMKCQYPSNGKTGYIVQFVPGKNIIDLEVVNTGGPAGIVMCLAIEDPQPTIENNAIKILSSTRGSSFYVTSSNWSYLTNNNNAVTPFSQSFSVEKCGEYAYNNGYQYFGLQNMINNDPNSAQCFISNDLAQATKYGKWDGSTTINGNTVGLGNVSAVYNFASSGDYNNIGKLGYINDDQQLIEYPSSMIQTGTSNSYTTFMNVDSPGNDIAGLNVNQTDCEQKCNENMDCYGYLYGPVNNCYLKNKNVFSYLNKDGPLNPLNGFNLHVKDVQVLNNNSCPKKIKNVNSLDWANYTKSKEIMNMDTTCRLDKINKELIKERDKKAIDLNWVTNQISNGLSSLMTRNDTMTQQMKTEHNVMKDNLSLYDMLYGKYKQIMNFDNSNVNNILANSQITVLQSRYFYILWAILAIAVVIALIILIRKYTMNNNS